MSMNLGTTETVRWDGDVDGHAILIDQTRLPDTFEEMAIRTPDDMIAAIQRLSVRGAPAIGVAAAYGVCLSTRGLTTPNDIDAALAKEMPRIRESRPTAVNLHHMVDRMSACAEQARAEDVTGVALRERLLSEAKRIHEEDRELCRRIGEAGAALVDDGIRVLTHCNAGALATAGAGTALSVFYEAQRQGKRFEVVADETRPLLQGARLTAWEMQRAGIPVTVICDNAAGHLFSRGEIQLVITGADRIAANGDSANKIGTYTVACLAKQHGVPFYIAAPSTTFDFEVATGAEIPIEERSAEEVWRVSGKMPVPEGIRVRNPAFDVTPASMIAGWITEKGVIQPPFGELKG